MMAVKVARIDDGVGQNMDRKWLLLLVALYSTNEMTTFILIGVAFIQL